MMESSQGEKRHHRFPAPSNAKKSRMACERPEYNISSFPALKACLPDSFDYHVCEYSGVGDVGDHHSYTATLRMALLQEDQVKLWLKAHSVTWRVDRTVPGKGQKVLFKVEYRCQHNTRPRRQSQGPTKNTDCPAKMNITVLRTHVSRGRQSRSTDPHLPDFPTVVWIRSEHNHNISTAAALRHRDVGDAARAKLRRLFEAGHSPSSALDALKCDLQLEYGDDYVFASADRALCPTLEFCYRLYHQLSRQELGGVKTMKTMKTMKTAKTMKMAADGVPLLEKLDSTCDELCALVCSRDELRGPASAFIQTFDRIKHDPSMLAAALHTFGHQGAVKRPSQRALCRTSSRAEPAAETHPASAAGQAAKLEERWRPAAGGALNTPASQDHGVQTAETDGLEQAVDMSRSNAKS
ncbi:uncharacterized protein LOC115355529 [Myripristis murdjan]|uniref:uncharacterized protein LOC115355529 n=1 Tax=Myripristis murdjan TaxID=586833 RepID=UPI0011762E46|nr:uncharacterized protein LOC115355529 [Myripristis murdjan]